MAGQTTRRCHWVSQSYLRSFSVVGDRSRIWRFSKTEGDPEIKRIDKVAVRNHLYAPLGADGKRADALEKKLSDLEQWFGHRMWTLLCNDEVDLSWEPLRKMLALIDHMFSSRHTDEVLRELDADAMAYENTV